MHGTLRFYESLRRARDSLCVEKAAHAVTRAKLQHCEAELAKLQGSGGSVRTVAVDTQGSPHDHVIGIFISPLLLGMIVGPSAAYLIMFPLKLGQTDLDPPRKGHIQLLPSLNMDIAQTLLGRHPLSLGTEVGQSARLVMTVKPVRKEAAADAVRT